MRPRLIYSLLAVAALLALAVGVGSALVPPASRSRGETLREPATPERAETHDAVAVASPDPPSPRPTAPARESATAAPAVEPPTVAVEVAPTDTAIVQAVAPIIEAEAVPTATSPALRLPAKDRVG